MDYQEELKICPYDPSHRVEPIKYAKHLQRCRKANPHMKIEVCPFNSSHHIPSYAMNYHIEKCEYKQKFVPTADFPSDQASAEPLQARALSPERRYASFHPEDDWEAEAKASATSSYNPEISILYSTNSRTPDPSLGLGKAGRRNWRISDAERIERIKNNKPIEDVEYPTADGGWISIGEMVFGASWKEGGQDYEEQEYRPSYGTSLNEPSQLDDSSTKKKKKLRKKKPIQINVESSDPSVEESSPSTFSASKNVKPTSVRVKFRDPLTEGRERSVYEEEDRTSTKKKKRKPRKQSVEEKMRHLHLG